jgi:hypothetical protein
MQWLALAACTYCRDQIIKHFEPSDGGMKFKQTSSRIYANGCWAIKGGSDGQTGVWTNLARAFMVCGFAHGAVAGVLQGSALMVQFF